MELMELNFKTEEGAEISLNAQERAVECSVSFKGDGGELNEITFFWLSAREAKALGQALMAVGEGSLTQGREYE